MPTCSHDKQARACSIATDKYSEVHICPLELIGGQMGPNAKYATCDNVCERRGLDCLRTIRGENLTKDNGLVNVEYEDFDVRLNCRHNLEHMDRDPLNDEIDRIKSLPLEVNNKDVPLKCVCIAKKSDKYENLEDRNMEDAWYAVDLPDESVEAESVHLTPKVLLTDNQYKKMLAVQEEWSTMSAHLRAQEKVQEKNTASPLSPSQTEVAHGMV